jgi:hypothetical protein
MLFPKVNGILESVIFVVGDCLEIVFKYHTMGMDIMSIKLSNTVKLKLLFCHYIRNCKFFKMDLLLHAAS